MQTIGTTPIVEINKLNKNKNVKIYAKLESFNPGGSIKDRTALEMVEQAELSGELTKNKTIIEASSGNTAIALSMISAIKGYKFIAVMSELASIERIKMIKAYGGEIILTSITEGKDAPINKVKQLLKENSNKYFYLNQYANKNNNLVHYKKTAEEIISQVNNIDVFIAGKGTTGTLIGIGSRLKEFNSKTKIVGVEPNINHKISGLKNLQESMIPEIYYPEILDGTIFIEDRDAFNTTKELARKEGIFAGISSGASMFVALQIAKKMKKGNIVVIFPDSGNRYLSTGLFD